MSSVVLTTSGASFMATAGTMFPAMPIRYFLLSYDYRIDPYVMPTSGLTLISAAETTSAVGLGFGDIIYNVDSLTTSAYSISHNEFLLYDSNQSGTTTISNNRFDGTSFITLLNGRPLSNSISATSIVYNYPNWTTNGYTLVTGNNSVPTGYVSATDKYFRVNSFAPISCAAGGLSDGLFKIISSNVQGNFKFNKVLLYASKILSGGVEDTSVAPVLVGIAYLNSPVIKSNDGSNLNFFEADIEIQFSANNYFGNVSYLNNTAWNYVGSSNSLWWDGSAILGSSAVPGSWNPQAKLHIVEPNPARSHLRLTDDNANHYVDHFFTHESNTTDDYIIKTHRPALHHYLVTSGADIAQVHTYLDAQGMIRSLLLESDTSVSGLHQTGFTAAYGGYLEKMNIVASGNVLATFRTADFLSDYATLVLGSSDNILGSDDSYEDPHRFLTVNGGATFTSKKGLIASGTNDVNFPNVSACGWIIGDSLYGTLQIVTDGIVGAYKGLKDLDPTNLQTNHFNVLGMTQFYTSADFYTKAKFLQGISAIGNSEIVGHLNVSGSTQFQSFLSTYGNTTLNAQLSVYALSFFHDKITGLSALFTNDVVVQNNLLVQNTVSANNGFWESSRTARMGVWTDYVPDLELANGSTGAITATTTNKARYMLVGKTLFVQFYYDIKATLAIYSITVSLPSGMTADASTAFVYNGSVNYYSNLDGAGVKYEAGMVQIQSGDVLATTRRVGLTSVTFPTSTSVEARGFFAIPIT